MQDIIGRLVEFQGRVGQIVETDGTSGIALLYKVRFFDGSTKTIADTNFKLLYDGCAPDCGERSQCPDAGKSGHQFCGWCATHDKPRHHCGCFIPIVES